MLLTKETRDELQYLLTAVPDWLIHLKWYGGLSSPVAFDRDWRVNRGELYDAYWPLIEKLRQIKFNGQCHELKLSDNEIVCCGWFFKKHSKAPERGSRISPELCKAFYDIPNSARIKGQRLYLPFDSKCGHHLNTHKRC